MRRKPRLGTGGRAAVLAVLTSVVVVLLMAVPTGVRRGMEDFDGYPPGTVVAGEKPGGGFAAGDLFPDFTLSVENHGNGPHSLILFDSSQPTGGDPDLGAPNETLGGPGVGAGGEAGQPGENADALGNLLIIAEDIIDEAPADGRVDDPDDEAGGGSIRFDFRQEVFPLFLALIDIDDRSRATIELYHGENLVGSVPAAPLGDNSVQLVSLLDFGIVTGIAIHLDGSGGVGWIEYQPAVTGRQTTSWGQVKSLFR